MLFLFFNQLFQQLVLHFKVHLNRHFDFIFGGTPSTCLNFGTQQILKTGLDVARVGDEFKIVFFKLLFVIGVLEFGETDLIGCDLIAEVAAAVLIEGTETVVDD